MLSMTDYAQMYIGTPYKWGGNDPRTGFDCSGFICEVLRAYKVIGYTDLSSQMLYDKMRIESKGISYITKGSLLFFGNDDTSITHVAMAINDWQMIEASGGDDNGFVRVRPISSRSDLIRSFYIRPKKPTVTQVYKIPFVKKMWDVYNAQKARCNNPNNSHYHSYGGKGVRVKYDFWTFLDWAISSKKKFDLKYCMLDQSEKKNRPSVGRIDHDGNYEIGNVELVTLRDNVLEKNERHGKVPGQKLNEEDVRAIRKRCDEGFSLTQVAREFGISFQNVSKIKNRTRWAHVQ